MREVLKQHLVELLGADVPHLDLVLEQFIPVQVKRNTLLLEQGQVCGSVYFIAQGCLQVFVYDADMNETTRDIVIENHWCSELMSFGSGQPATENIRAVEPSYLLAIDRARFQEMMHRVPQFDQVYKQVLEASYANSVYRLNTFVSLTALQRMEWLRHYRPGLMNRLSSKLIASYLGIHKDVYSRLKRQL
ncbi:MAG: cyclic nucleotide-binding domain-containing protein [Bacteroidetes bacterium]|nr:cyclic nucleotide-binding domain-containing protein [Bacteroidota bacterium]